MAYSRSISIMHWATAVPAIGCVGTVLKSQSLPKDDPSKGTWMFIHKSLGTLTAILVLPRVGLRAVSMIGGMGPKPVPGPRWEQAAARISHLGLYGFITVMPLTGVAMGYYGGKGLPFFAGTIPGATGAEVDKKLAGQAYKVHKLVGEYGKFLIPLHAGAALFHLARGQAVFSRVNPFRRPS
eukprot:CAMPEP_0119137768 /NCGR_PEP_ID=MMETSP1310-20130426/24314_1 /TAXON_ID=464262 /ORGANISM="Genus nov. species nov., Strain RCC2339" /LENGTH=181 /DNA_ID=CAMNT_0007128883 /DNA_START=43 /DNA_END=588 /DNA_ORIENTATION=+